jgi:glycosyltransferase involved in cell wall biosynthesis
MTDDATTPPAPDRTLEVVVGMPTFRRPAELARAVPLLLDQVRGLQRAHARVVIVDNDPAAGAREFVEGLAEPELSYVHEPRPGISAARNCAIAAAGTADAIVFIDDDEVPHDGWLQALVDGWIGWGCAAVTGPVNPVFEGEVDDWVRASGVFARAERTTGSSNPGAWSGNLLLDLRVLRRHGLGFDEDFGLTGGSDTMLAHSLKAHGEQIRWCQEAEVSEHVPASRLGRDWVFKRTIRTSNTWSRVGMALASSPPSRLRKRAELTARGTYRMARGSAMRVAGRARRDVPTDARGAMDIASGIGLVMGAYGRVRSEYARPTTG